MIIASLSADAQQSEARGQATTAQSKTTHNFLVQHEIGQRFKIDPTDLPAPKTGPIVTNRPLIGDVLVAEQSAGYLTLLRGDGNGHAEWIDRHVEDLNKPYDPRLAGQSCAGG